MFDWYSDIPLHGVPHFIYLFSLWHGYLTHRYLMFTHHCYICSPHECTCMYCFYLRVITVHMTCMIVPCYHIHVICLFPVTDTVIPLLDTWAVDIQCVDFHSYCFPFPVIVFHAINRVHDMLSYLFLLYCIVIDNKENLGMGETWRLTRSYRVDVWIHCLSHCRGRGSAGYRLLLMSSRFPLLF